MAETYTRFVLKHTYNRKIFFIGVDMAGGGYPYNVDAPWDAHFWVTKEEAQAYWDKFPNEPWEIWTLKAEAYPTPDTAVAQALSEYPGQPIAAIKRYRELTGAGLREAKDAIMEAIRG